MDRDCEKEITDSSLHQMVIYGWDKRITVGWEIEGFSGFLSPAEYHLTFSIFPYKKTGLISSLLNPYRITIRCGQTALYTCSATAMPTMKNTARPRLTWRIWK